MRSTPLTRAEVCEVISAWGSGSLTDEQMHFWAMNNYFPAHQVVAPDEPDNVALAIGTVLTEIECAKQPYLPGNRVAPNALALIEAREEDYEHRKNVFLASCG